MPTRNDKTPTRRCGTWTCWICRPGIMDTNRDMRPKALNLNACDREPIHVPESIQPRGIGEAVRAAEACFDRYARACLD